MKTSPDYPESQLAAPRWPALLALLAFCVLSRVPSFRASFDPDLGWYLWNFSPLLATCLFCGATYRSYYWAGVAPLLAYLLGDVAVWIVSGQISDAFHPISLWTYVALALVVACGAWLRRREQSWPQIIAASLGGALVFFVLTNFGSWAMDGWLPSPTGYDRGWAGLLQSYVAALPFWRNDLSAMLLFSGLFFSPLGRSVLTRESAAPAAAARPEPAAPLATNV